MESLFAIGVGLVLRLVVEVATDNDHRVGGVLVGLWEGIVLSHFLRRMPHSYDPYIAFAVRVFIDFLFTQSLSRMALVALWTLVGMLLADVAPRVWRDSGLKRVYRRLRRDVRHITHAVPEIRIKNDIPSVRLFSRKRVPSTVVSSSIRSDRATPGHSPSPGLRPTPRAPRRPGRTPPGALPDTSGWSETETDVTALRARLVMSPGPSPALIPTRVHAERQPPDAPTLRSHMQLPESEPMLLESVRQTRAHASTSALVAGPADVPSTHDLATIPDDWVDIPSVPPLSELQEPPTLLAEPAPLRPASVVEPTPRISTIPDIPDMDPHTASASRQTIRAKTVIGGVEESSSALRFTTSVEHTRKAFSELGIDPIPPVTPFSKPFNTSLGSLDEKTPDVPPKDKAVFTAGEPAGGPSDTQGKVDTQGIATPSTQVDPSGSTGVLNTPVDAPSAPVPQQKEAAQTTVSQSIPLDDGNADTSPAAQKDTLARADASRSKRDSYLDPDPPSDPPPSFNEAVGGSTAGVQGSSDPVTQDEAPTELTQIQKVTEQRRLRFLKREVGGQETARNQLQAKLEEMEDKDSDSAERLRLRMGVIQGTIDKMLARISKKRFSDAPAIPEVHETKIDAGCDLVYEITKLVQSKLLDTNHADPITIRTKWSRRQKQQHEASLQAFAQDLGFTWSATNAFMTMIV